MRFNTVCYLSFILPLFFSCENRPDHGDYQVSGVEQPEISLNGIWNFTMHPPSSYGDEQLDRVDWKEVKVPGELVMQGFPIRHDSVYLYMMEFEVPDDFFDHKILLRFDGVYSEANVWVNGQRAGNHIGGFTRWELDITGLVNRNTNTLLVEVIDRWDDISWASGYAQHQIGGILRDVTLRAAIKNQLDFFYVETELDDEYENADLLLNFGTSGTEDLDVEFKLFDPEGNEVALNLSSASLNPKGSISVKNPIANPKKWDAEHPHLYRLKVRVSDSKNAYSFTEKIGFREV